jgi:hypothetical protein
MLRRHWYYSLKERDLRDYPEQGGSARKRMNEMIEHGPI